MSTILTTETRFSQSPETLRQIAQDLIQYASQQGATACSAEVSDGFGQAVTVRQGEVETIEYNRDKGLGVTVYIGQKRGNASSSDFSPQAVRDTVLGDTPARSATISSVAFAGVALRCRIDLCTLDRPPCSLLAQRGSV